MYLPNLALLSLLISHASSFSLFFPSPPTSSPFAFKVPLGRNNPAPSGRLLRNTGRTLGSARGATETDTETDTKVRERGRVRGGEQIVGGVSLRLSADLFWPSYGPPQSLKPPADGKSFPSVFCQLEKQRAIFPPCVRALYALCFTFFWGTSLFSFLFHLLHRHHLHCLLPRSILSCVSVSLPPSVNALHALCFISIICRSFPPSLHLLRRLLLCPCFSCYSFFFMSLLFSFADPACSLPSRRPTRRSSA